MPGCGAGPAQNYIPYITIAKSADESTLLDEGLELEDVLKFYRHVRNI